MPARVQAVIAARDGHTKYWILLFLILDFFDLFSLIVPNLSLVGGMFLISLFLSSLNLLTTIACNYQ